MMKPVVLTTLMLALSALVASAAASADSNRKMVDAYEEETSSMRFILERSAARSNNCEISRNFKSTQA